MSLETPPLFPLLNSTFKEKKREEKGKKRGKGKNLVGYCKPLNNTGVLPALISKDGVTPS